MKKIRFRALVAATLIALTGLVGIPQKADALASASSWVAEPGDFPWIADVGGCTGALVDPSWVVTAAHCLVSDGDTAPSGTVYTGASVRLAQSKTELRADRLFVMPGYLPGRSHDHDVGLLHLEKPSSVAPIHPGSPFRSTDQDLTKPGKAVFQAGFGQPGDGQSPDGKLRVAWSIVAERGPDRITTQHLVNKGGVAHPEELLCHGDSGGPVFAPHPGGQLRLMAVHSEVYDSGWTNLTTPLDCGPFAVSVRLDRVDVYEWMESMIRPSHRPGAITQMPADGANGRYDSTGKLVTTQATKTNWGRGWTSVEYFRHAGRDYMIRYQEKAGTSDVWELNQATGVPTTRQFVGAWTSGWTSVKPYTVGGRTFLMLLKVGDGTAVVNEVVRNINGTLKLTELERKSWTVGWSAAEMFQAGGKTWMLLAKGSTGEVHIHQMAAATTGTWTHTANIGAGWETIRAFDVAGKPFVFLMDEETGQNQTRTLNSNGSLGGVVQSGASPAGSTASFYKVNGATYIVRSGAGYANFVVRGMDPSGTVGSKLQEAPEDFGNTNVQGYNLASGKTLAYSYKEGRL